MPFASSHTTSADYLPVEPLTNEQREEVLNFLALRPIHTVCMTSYIRDHGIESPLNRGLFFGFRGNEGELAGVALIGHATLIETQSDEALKAFAELKHFYPNSHLIRGEHELIQRFWKHYEQVDQTPQFACREVLFEQRQGIPVIEPAPDIRLATDEDLSSIVRINAHMIIAECGMDPMVRDPDGFLARVTRRIKQGRVWVWVKDGRMVFKADVFAETPEMSYLEGINVHPLYRGMGYGQRCMARLSEILLQRSAALCLLVNEEHPELCRFYEKAGFTVCGTYDTIYLDTKIQSE